MEIVSTDFRVSDEKNYRQARERAAALPDVAVLDGQITRVETDIQAQKKSLLLNRGRRLFGLRAPDDEAAQRALAIAEATLGELRAKREEVIWQRAAVAEAMPEIEGRAKEIVGRRLIAEAKRRGMEIDGTIQQLQKQLDEAAPIVEAIERQFSTLAVNGYARLDVPFRGAGPIIGVLNYWCREHRGTLKDRIKVWRSICHDCGVKL